ncbi:malonyl-ACP O-methyltransferase BioC [Paenibacillus sp. 481]|uniref:malonyl-ACP O-methyltransferase BioC n=1 Tax=Paenibacillus sp. 481 TaxID=2835869 RepID=UPI001E4165C9|nr:malonyl-ACP O-methyltransferase BioC [Paenibacillus sp. 481]UHA71790.1 malonyl-ACP O-methyltransferase BioC [Paenibacillus sp. 481]
MSNLNMEMKTTIATASLAHTHKDVLTDSIDKGLVQRRFDRHAHEYDQYAEVQKQMADQLAEHIKAAMPPIHNNSTSLRILDIGCGTGMLTERLMRTYPQSHVTLLDLSPRMLEQALAKLNHIGIQASAVEVIAEDAETWAERAGRLRHEGKEDVLPKNKQNAACAQVEASFDLIVSSAAFQWFNRPDETLTALCSLLRPGGVLAFATFMPGTLGELHAAFAAAEAALGLPPSPRGQSYPTGHDWSRWCASPTVARPLNWEERCYTHRYSSTDAMLRHVRRIGAGNAVVGRSAAPNRALHARWQAEYAARFSASDGSVPASYYVGYGLLHMDT